MSDIRKDEKMVKVKVWRHFFRMEDMRPKTECLEKMISVSLSFLPKDFDVRILEATIANTPLDEAIRIGVLSYDTRQDLYNRIGRDFLKNTCRALVEIHDGIYLCLYDVFGSEDRDSHEIVCENELTDI